MTCRVVAIRADQRFGREIHVVDVSVIVRCYDTFRDRLQRVLGLALAARQGHFETLSVTDIPGNRQYRSLPAIFDV